MIDKCVIGTAFILSIVSIIIFHNMYMKKRVEPRAMDKGYNYKEHASNFNFQDANHVEMTSLYAQYRKLYGYISQLHFYIRLAKREKCKLENNIKRATKKGIDVSDSTPLLLKVEKELFKSEQLLEKDYDFMEDIVNEYNKRRNRYNIPGLPLKLEMLVYDKQSFVR